MISAEVTQRSPSRSEENSGFARPVEAVTGDVHGGRPRQPLAYGVACRRVAGQQPAAGNGRSHRLALAEDRRGVGIRNGEDEYAVGERADPGTGRGDGQGRQHGDRPLLHQVLAPVMQCVERHLVQLAVRDHRERT